MGNSCKDKAGLLLADEPTANLDPASGAEDMEVDFRRKSWYNMS